jgi:hypothetical protein
MPAFEAVGGQQVDFKACRVMACSRQAHQSRRSFALPVNLLMRARSPVRRVTAVRLLRCAFNPRAR